MTVPVSMSTASIPLIFDEVKINSRFEYTKRPGLVRSPGRQTVQTSTGTAAVKAKFSFAETVRQMHGISSGPQTYPWITRICWREINTALQEPYAQAIHRFNLQSGNGEQLYCHVRLIVTGRAEHRAVLTRLLAHLCWSILVLRQPPWPSPNQNDEACAVHGNEFVGMLLRANHLGNITEPREFHSAVVKPSRQKLDNDQSLLTIENEQNDSGLDSQLGEQKTWNNKLNYQLYWSKAAHLVLQQLMQMKDCFYIVILPTFLVRKLKHLENGSLQVVARERARTTMEARLQWSDVKTLSQGVFKGSFARAFRLATDFCQTFWFFVERLGHDSQRGAVTAKMPDSDLIPHRESDHDQSSVRFETSREGGRSGRRPGKSTSFQPLHLLLPGMQTRFVGRPCKVVLVRGKVLLLGQGNCCLFVASLSTHPR
jgi:hypothetical protein